MRTARAVLALVLLSASSLLAATAHGQPLSRGGVGVSPPPVSLVAPGDAVAVDVNPGAVALLDSWMLTYVHADAQSNDELLGRGDAGWLALPLPLGLGLGASVHSVRPSASLAAADRGAFSVAAGFAPSRRFGIGATVRHVVSDEATVDGLTALDVGTTWRPGPRVGLALLARDLDALVDATADADGVRPTFLLAAAFRPYGTDALTLEAAPAIDTDGEVGLRGMLGLRVPHVGRATAVAEVDDLSGDNALRVLGGLAVDWGALGIEGGVIEGDGFEGGPGWYVAARLSGASRRGLPRPRYVADVEVRGDLDERGVLGVVRRLDRALHDERVAGVLLRLRSTDAGLAYAQELRLMIEQLERAGKPVICHLDAGSGGELYACAAASRLLLDPAGGVRLTGPQVEVVLLGGLLDRVGVRADFVRIGSYKSAPEQLENVESSAPAREQRGALLDDAFRRLAADLARDWDVSVEQARDRITRGPYAAPEALEAEVADEVADERVLGAVLREGFGGSYRRLEERPDEARRSWGVGPRIGVVVVDGSIVDGDNVDVPLLDIHMSGGRTVSAAIDRLAADSSVEAIVLRVDSPGGSALASDQIWRAVRRARKRKPVIASLGAVAASGGYYVASGADEIWADPSTVTGSIGIFFGKLDVTDLAERVGVSVESLRRGRHAGFDSPWRPFTPEERAMVSDKIRLWYRLFLERVADSRGMSVEEVDAVGRGRVWSGDAAVGEGLVDRLGGFGAALARAREVSGLGPEAPIVIVPGRPQTLLEYALGAATEETRAAAARAVPPQLRRAAALAATFGHVRAGMPLALLPHHIRIQ